MELTVNFKVSCQLLGAINFELAYPERKVQIKAGGDFNKLVFHAKLQEVREDFLQMYCTTFVAEGSEFFSSHQTEVIIHYRKMCRDRIRSFNASLVLNRIYNSNNIQKAMWDTINKNT